MRKRVLYLISRVERNLAGQRTGPGPAPRGHPMGGHAEGVFPGDAFAEGKRRTAGPSPLK